jgi:hypothetical protein
MSSDLRAALACARQAVERVVELRTALAQAEADAARARHLCASELDALDRDPEELLVLLGGDER